MRKILKRIGVSLIIAALLVSLIPTGEASAATDYQFSGDTLVTYTGTAQAVSVPSTVKTVGEGAFAGNSTIESVTMGSGTKKIAYAAFSNMSALKSLTTGNSVKSIGHAAFSGDYNLTDVTLGSAVEELGSGAFIGCYNLTTLSLDKANKDFVVANGAIYNRKMTTLYELLPGYQNGTFTVPDSVTTIKEYAFYGCNSLESVTLGANITSIPAFCFANCLSLQTVSIPYSCTRIEMNAFLGDVNLTYLQIPPSVYVIDDSAFDGCFRLTISAQSGTAGDAAAKHLEDITEADASEFQDTADVIKTIDNIPDASGNDVSGNEGTGVISGNEGDDGTAPTPAPEGNAADGSNPDQSGAGDTFTTDTSTTDPTRNLLGNGRVNGSHVVVFVDNTQLRVRDGEDTDYLPATSSSAPSSAVEAQEAGSGSTMSNLYELMKEANEKGDVLPKFTVVDGQIVADQAFYNSRNETEPSIPEGISAIGSFAYARSNLTSAIIPEGVTTIDYAAFYHCDQLSEVQIPSTVSWIGPYAFDRTKYLADWMKTGEEFLIVGDGYLLSYGGGYSGIHIPEGVKHIGPYAFAGHKGITNVTLPESLLTIEEGAFSNCTNLSSLSGGSNLIAIKDRAFYNCPISVYTIPATTQTIGLGAFANDADHESERNLIFAGSVLPRLSYEDTATRLSNEDYRIAPLDGVDMAIVTPDVTDLSGSVLAPGAFGFTGLIPDHTQEVSSNDAADADSDTASAENTVSESNAAEVSVHNNATAYLPGEGGAISLPGNGNSGSSPAAGQGSQTGWNSIINTHTFLTDNFTAWKLEGAGRDFVLKIGDTEDAGAKLEQAYKRTYGEMLPSNCLIADISLFEASGTVPVTKLGTQSIAISMTVPDTLYGGKLHVVALDANGQLEEMPYTRSNDTATKTSRITFRTNHFSTFGFYSVGGTTYGSAVVSGGKAIFSSQLDDSPDTGDLIHPKWFLVLGLIFAGIACLLAGSMKRYRKQ
ncbi:MAG: leucine-rich repeat domain-containing protein [Lachnospiraceae bacterium]|nr:leucine-rich repeat domain-containing protein [Lachnospiraceae bacterium]